MQLELGGDEGGGELGVGGGAGAGAPDLRRDVVQLFAVLVGYYGTRGGAGVGSDLEGSALGSWRWRFAVLLWEEVLWVWS